MIDPVALDPGRFNRICQEYSNYLSRYRDSDYDGYISLKHSSSVNTDGCVSAMLSALGVSSQKPGDDALYATR